VKSEIPKILEEMKERWESISTNDARFSKCYDFFSKISTHNPLSIIDFCLDSPELDNVPKQIKEIIERGIKGFSLRPYYSMRKELNDFIKFCGDKYPHLPESKLLKKIAQNWYDQIQLLVNQHYEPAIVRTSLSPSLELDISAEEQKENTCLRDIILPLAITNLGKFPILDVRLHLFLEGAVPVYEKLKRLDDSTCEIDFKSAIAAGETEVTYVHLLMSADTKVIIHTYYQDFLQEFTITEQSLDYLKEENASDELIERLRNFENRIFRGRDKFSDILKSMIGDDKNLGDKSLSTKYIEFLLSQSFPNNIKSSKFEISIPISVQHEIEKINNPYTPNKPLVSEWQIKNLMQGKHDKVAKKIMSDLKIHESKVHFIRGLNRSGKTSILLELKYLINKEKSYLPIYIDFYTWWSIILKKNLTIDIEGLLYELANSASQEAYLLDLDTTSVDNYLKEFEEEMCMSYQDFKVFIKRLSEISSKKYYIVFLLDELDWWIRDIGKMQDVTHKLVSYMSGLIQEGFCSVVVATMWSNQEWKRKLLDSKVLLIPNVIEFFEREDIEKLSYVNVVSNKTHLFYTPLSIEFIWRISGGWPGIVQLIFYRIIEKLKVEESSDGIIDIGLVRKVVEEIINSEDNRPFVVYHLKSLEISEIKFLKQLVILDLIRKNSGEINQIRKSKGEGFILLELDASQIKQKDINAILTSLESKQILEPIGKESIRFRLRVGLLSYLVVLSLHEGGL